MLRPLEVFNTKTIANGRLGYQALTWLQDTLADTLAHTNTALVPFSFHLSTAEWLKTQETELPMPNILVAPSKDQRLNNAQAAF